MACEMKLLKHGHQGTVIIFLFQLIFQIQCVFCLQKAQCQFSPGLTIVTVFFQTRQDIICWFVSIRCHVVETSCLYSLFAFVSLFETMLSLKIAAYICIALFLLNRTFMSFQTLKCSKPKSKHLNMYCFSNFFFLCSLALVFKFLLQYLRIWFRLGRSKDCCFV